MKKSSTMNYAIRQLCLAEVFSLNGGGLLDEFWTILFYFDESLEKLISSTVNIFKISVLRSTVRIEHNFVISTIYTLF